MGERRATCGCGGLQLVCQGEPARVSICHCHACQRRTGSVFGVQARYPAEQVRAEGASAVWRRVGDSGGEVSSHFCPTCGATVWLEVDRLPGFVVVAVGAFADAAFPPPTVSVHEDRRHPWVDLDRLHPERFA